MATYIRFECGQEDRTSRIYGPFPFVQLTYDQLRVGPNGDEFAWYDPEADEWLLLEDAKAGHRYWYSDVIIYSEDPNDK